MLFRSDRLPEEGGVRTYLVVCALLTLTLGWGLRGVQIRDFIAPQIRAIPAYTGTEHRVIIRNPTGGLDPTRNDPFLRGNVVYLLGHGPAADAVMMHEHFPGLRRVSTESEFSVWSTASATISGEP